MSFQIQLDVPDWDLGDEGGGASLILGDTKPPPGSDPAPSSSHQGKRRGQAGERPAAKSAKTQRAAKALSQLRLAEVQPEADPSAKPNSKRAKAAAAPAPARSEPARARSPSPSGRSGPSSASGSASLSPTSSPTAATAAADSESPLSLRTLSLEAQQAAGPALDARNNSDGGPAGNANGNANGGASGNWAEAAEAAALLIRPPTIRSKKKGERVSAAQKLQGAKFRMLNEKVRELRRRKRRRRKTNAEWMASVCVCCAAVVRGPRSLAHSPVTFLSSLSFTPVTFVMVLADFCR